MLFLYTELSGYFLSSVARFCEKYDAEAHVVRWPLHPDAPFKFADFPGITMYERKDHDRNSLMQLADQISPQLIYVAGWMDKEYLSVARKWKAAGTPVVCALDNQWRGDLRQRVACMVSGWVIHRKFSHAWVPGKFQFEFAKRLGFKLDHIEQGMYAADTSPFDEVWEMQSNSKHDNYPKRFLYVARIVESKGIEDLLEAYKIYREDGGEWKLRIVGTGDMVDLVKAASDVEYVDFVQPNELPALAADSGAFVLPSRFEPWGVVLHEFAAGGLPIVASDACGSATAFVENGQNGYIFPAKDAVSLADSLKKISSKNPSQLMQMAEHSRKLSKKISVDSWADTLMKMCSQ